MNSFSEDYKTLPPREKEHIAEAMRYQLDYYGLDLFNEMWMYGILDEVVDIKASQYEKRDVQRVMSELIEETL